MLLEGNQSISSTLFIVTQNYDPCFKLSIPSIYYTLFKYKKCHTKGIKINFFPSKISCESIFPLVIFLSKWIFIKGLNVGMFIIV
jgi:hypothetical protein